MTTQSNMKLPNFKKKFFLEFVYLPCFQSGIMVFCSMLPKNPILDHFMGKNEILGKNKQKWPKNTSNLNGRWHFMGK